METKELTNFLQYTAGQKEAALMLADNDQQISALEASLAQTGYTKATSPLLFLRGIYLAERTYIVLTETNAKEIYDICLQYPTGQISGFNPSKMKTLWIRPDYSKASIVVLANLDLIKKLETQGQSLRSVTGLTYQV